MFYFIIVLHCYYLIQSFYILIYAHLINLFINIIIIYIIYNIIIIGSFPFHRSTLAGGLGLVVWASGGIALSPRLPITFPLQWGKLLHCKVHALLSISAHLGLQGIEFGGG